MDDVSSLPNLGNGVTDVDGNVYATVIIGNQEWMAENLRTTSYANGDSLRNTTNSDEWHLGIFDWDLFENTFPGAWVHYGNGVQFEIPYGKIYNATAVIDSRNVCPTGWRVPSNSDWTELVDYLGGEDVAGGKMKNTGTGTGLWNQPNADASNTSGFSGLPGGYRWYCPSNIFSCGQFYGKGMFGFWWSSTGVNTENNQPLSLDFNSGSVSRSRGQATGMCIRCIKN